MNAQVTFDFTKGTVTPPGVLRFPGDPSPLARTTDPQTSHEAAERVKPGNSELVDAIRTVALRLRFNGREPATAFDFARIVNEQYPDRWDEGTIRTAIKRAGLRAVDTDGRSPRGQRCIRYTLGSL